MKLVLFFLKFHYLSHFTSELG